MKTYAYICRVINNTRKNKMKTLRLHTEQIQPQEPKSLRRLCVYNDNDLI